MSNDPLTNSFFDKPSRQLIAKALSSRFGTEVKVNRLHEHNAISWGLYLKPREGSAIANALDSDQEFLLWFCESKDFQIRTLNEAAHAIDNSANRLRKDFFLLVTADPATGTKARAAQVGRRAVQAIAMSVSEFLNLDSGGLAAPVQLGLFERDLFDVRTPLHGPDSFFGHSDLINALVDSAMTGGTAACLFGLRKTGKTSLLNQVRERLNERRNNEMIMVAFADMQSSSLTAQSSHFGDEFLRDLAGNLYDSAPWLRRDQNLVHALRLIGPAAATVKFEQHTGAMLFASDLKAIYKAYRSLKVLLILDEVELAYESSVVANTLPVMRFLRSLIQDPNFRCVSLIASGTNPRRVFANQVTASGGDSSAVTDNPFYDFFKRFYLAPLPQSISQQLLQRLGRRMGLEFGQDATAELHRLAGGHPALLRQLASRIHRSTKGKRPVQIDTAMVASRIDEFRRASEETCSQMLAVLERDYQDSFVILDALATGRVEQFRSYVEQFGSDAQLCIDYGLFDGPQSLRLNSTLLQSYMQRRAAAQAVGQVHSPGRFQPGDAIADYTILELIGEPGGFGEVYRARDNGTGVVYALKILHRADVRALNREVEVLERIQEKSGGHAGIVQLVSWAREESRGVLYLVMEYLDGRPLAYHCSAATRLANNLTKAKHLLVNVLEALEVLHPNMQRVEELRSASRERSLSQREYDELEEAKNGHVHRDIKPQNIIVVEGRGAVLIDFGITSAAQSPVNTMSHTPGYTPPQWEGSRWSADVDMYQLGVTFAQAIEGVRIEPGAMDVLGPLEGFFSNFSNYGQVGAVVRSLVLQDLDCRHASECLKRLR